MNKILLVLISFLCLLPTTAFAFLVMLPTSSAGGGSYALVSHTAAQAFGTTTTTSAINTTGASLLLIMASASNNATTITVADNKGNTYALAKDSPVPYSSSGQSGSLWYIRGGSVGSGHTATVTVAGSGNNAATVFFAAFSGGNATPLDQTNSNFDTNTSVSAGSITPTQSNELVIAALALGIAGSGSTGISLNGGFTIIDSLSNVPASLFLGGSLAYLVQTSAAAANPTWSWTNTALGFAVIASFK